MRVAVTGATGNVGSALLRAFEEVDEVQEVVAISRRPGGLPAKARGAAADVSRDDLVGPLQGCDAVVHLAWLIQPMRDRAALRRVNVEGTTRLLRAAVEAGVGTVVHASSVGAYSPGPADERVAEDHPTQGIPTCSYSVDKVACERLLDRFEADHPEVRVVRLRPGLIFQRTASPEQVDYFAGGHVPPFSKLIGRGLPPGVLPVPKDLRLQAVHADDVAQAYVRAVLADVRGPFNVAAEPVLGPRRLAKGLNAVPVPVPAAIVRAAVDVAYRTHVIPTEPGWFDLGMQSPIMDCSRARAELGWSPRRSAQSTYEEMLQGVRDGDRGTTTALREPSGA